MASPEPPPGEVIISIRVPGIHVKRDKLPSIAYSEELVFSMSATLQGTDRRHRMVGQEPCLDLAVTLMIWTRSSADWL